MKLPIIWILLEWTIVWPNDISQFNYLQADNNRCHLNNVSCYWRFDLHYMIEGVLGTSIIALDTKLVIIFQANPLTILLVLVTKWTRVSYFVFVLWHCSTKMLYFQFLYRKSKEWSSVSSSSYVLFLCRMSKKIKSYF